jgi:uncharacterized protein (TIGR02246 family)
MNVLPMIDMSRREALVALASIGMAACGSTRRLIGDRARGGDMNAVEAIKDIVAAFTAAWNRHDMDAFAALFHDDATFVNLRGSLWKGRGEIRDLHSQVHATFFRTSQLTQEVEDVSVLAPSVAVAHVHGQLRGDERFPDKVLNARMTVVVQERGGRWLIAAAHNTEIAPLPSSPQPRQ